MKLRLFCILFLCCSGLSAQRGIFINGNTASLRVDSTSFLSVDGDFQNLNCDPILETRFNGPLYLSGNLINNSVLKFSATTGSGNSKKARIIFQTSLSNPSGSLAIIGGTVIPKFWEVEIDKGLGALTLSTNINCLDTLNFKTGMVYMNGYKCNLIDPIGAPSVINHPYLKNERYGCQFMPSSINDTSLVIYKTIYNYSVDIDPGNIGLKVKGLLNIGSRFDIYRGFKSQSNAGKNSIHKYFDIYSPGHSLVNNTITVNYNYNDLFYFSPGYLNLNSLKLFVSANEDMNWSPFGSTIQNTLVTLSGPVHNGMMTANIADLSSPNINIFPKNFRITIADVNCPNPPVSGLLLDTLHICAGITQVLNAGNNAYSPNSAVRWEWNTTPVLYTQNHTVTPTAGFQKFVVKLMDDRGCETKDSVVIAPQAPYPQVTYFNHLNSCLGDSVTIKDTVKIISGTYSNSWLFSDGTSSSTSQKFFRKKFLNAGEFSMQLTVLSNYGCSVTATSTNIIVYPLPTAGFTNSFNCLSNQMSFTPTSISNHTALVISSNLWNLGQGNSNSTTVTSPAQSYSASGTYTVKLRSTSSFGCKDSVSHPIVIYPLNQAHFTKNNSCLNDTVFLNNTSVCNTGNCAYSWQLGDATLSNQASLKKVYAAPGLYTVKLKVTTTFGCPDSVSTNIFINPKPISQFTSSATDACINNYIYFTNTSNISSGSIAAYSWNFGNSAISASTNAAISYSVAGPYNVTLTATSDSGCVKNSVQQLIAHPQPTAQYAVSNVCHGSPSQFVSSSNGPGLSFVWNYGNSVLTTTLNSVVQNYSYPSPGTYSTQLIAINSWGCSDTVAVNTTVFTSPVAVLGGTVSTCGTTYTLNAGNTGATYFWQPGNQTTQTVQVNTSGLYQVSVTNTNNCTSSETVLVTLNSIVKPHLGNDTIVCGPFLLNAGYPGSVYLWNTTQLSQTINATTSGTYIVQVTDLNSCTGSDTIELVVNVPPILNLGNDLLTCKPKYGSILTPTSNASNFLWSNGVTTASLHIENTGSYWLEGTATNGCKKRDTLLVSFLNTPKLDLGPNLARCGNVLLDAQNIGCNYLWNDGTTLQTKNILVSDNYWVTVTNTLNACSQQDSAHITVHPLVSVFLGNDTTVCSNSGFQLNANNPGATYSWTSGQSTQVIPVTSPGIHGVTVTNTAGCFASSYISLTLTGAPNLDLGNNTRYLCGNNRVDLNVTVPGEVSWGSDQGLNSTTKSLSIQQEGKYWATVGQSGCFASDTVLVVATNNTMQALFLASTQDTVNKPVQFVNLSIPPPVSQLWTFGDGLSSTDLHPLHTFVLPQDFSVTLEVSNGFCSDKITKQISVLFRQTPPHSKLPVASLAWTNFELFPNPSDRYIELRFSLNDFATVDLIISDLSGRLISREQIQASIYHSSMLDLQNFKNGMYLISITAHSTKGELRKTAKFIKTN